MSPWLGAFFDANREGAGRVGTAGGHRQATDGREIRLRRVTTPTEEQNGVLRILSGDPEGRDSEGAYITTKGVVTYAPPADSGIAL